MACFRGEGEEKVRENFLCLLLSQMPRCHILHCTSWTPSLAVQWWLHWNWGGVKCSRSPSRIRLFRFFRIRGTLTHTCVCPNTHMWKRTELERPPRGDGLWVGACSKNPTVPVRQGRRSKQTLKSRAPRRVIRWAWSRLLPLHRGPACVYKLQLASLEQGGTWEHSV